MKKNQKNSKNVFEGEGALFDFLNPESHTTPLVELPLEFNKWKKDKVRIFLKFTHFLPVYNIKSVFAWAMLEGMKKKGVKHLAEYSSGNTAISLTVLAKYFGVKSVHPIITPDVPADKRKLLKLLGAHILVSGGPPSPDVFSAVGGIHEANTLAKKKGWHTLNQYTNPASPEASARHIGRQVWEQTDGGVTIYSASIGTAGTIYGASQFLKKKNKNILTIGSCIKAGSSIPGPRGEMDIPKLAFPWAEVVDETYPIDRKSAFVQSLRLIRAGLFVGPSTGMQIIAIDRLIKKLKNKKALKQYKNKNGEVVVVLTSADSMFPYLDEYFSIIPKKYFHEEKKVEDSL